MVEKREKKTPCIATILDVFTKPTPMWFTILPQNVQAEFHLSNVIITEVGLYGYAIYPMQVVKNTK